MALYEALFGMMDLQAAQVFPPSGAKRLTFGMHQWLHQRTAVVSTGAGRGSCSIPSCMGQPCLLAIQETPCKVLAPCTGPGRG